MIIERIPSSSLFFFSFSDTLFIVAFLRFFVVRGGLLGHYSTFCCIQDSLKNSAPKPGKEDFREQAPPHS